MELRKNLELVDVAYENDGKKVVMTFLDEERGEVRIVNFNRQAYDNGKFVDDPSKAAKVDEWCEDFFGTKFNKLTDCIGQKKDVYVYDRFNSLFETKETEKFTPDMLGDIITTVIDEVQVDDLFIRVLYTDPNTGKQYESKQTLGKYVETLKKWFVDPIKRDKEYAKFEDKFGVPVTEKDALVGKNIIVEVKCAFGKFYYGEIKKFPKK